MTTKPKRTKTVAGSRRARPLAQPKPRTPPAAREVSAPPTERRNLAAAEILTMPSAQNARVLQAWGRLGEVDLSAIADRLRHKAQAVINGDTDTVEALLFDQALALQAIFTNLSIEAARSENLSRLDPLLRLALKAQSQSRSTLETLTLIKNPTMVFAKQANINNGGQQQVNNGGHQASSAPAANNRSAPTELLEDDHHGQWMDAGATSTARRADSRLETVGAVDRPQDTAGQGAKQEQPVPRRRAAETARDAENTARRNGRKPSSA